jgi:hypothetical protein
MCDIFEPKKFVLPFEVQAFNFQRMQINLGIASHMLLAEDRDQ